MVGVTHWNEKCQEFCAFAECPDIQWRMGPIMVQVRAWRMPHAAAASVTVDFKELSQQKKFRLLWFLSILSYSYWCHDFNYWWKVYECVIIGRLHKCCKFISINIRLRIVPILASSSICWVPTDHQILPINAKAKQFTNIISLVSHSNPNISCWLGLYITLNILSSMLKIIFSM